MIPVFFNQKMNVESNASYSPSAGKPAQVIDDWKSIPDVAKHLKFVESGFATEKDFACAHNPEYVMAVLSGQRDNGFGNRSLEVADSLRYTTGSMLHAAQSLLDTDGLIAVSPTSGFHHAGYQWGGGFCTFNGLMVTAMRLKMRKLVERVLIIDGDAHYGNGTDDIIEKTKSSSWIKHITAGKHYHSPSEFFQATCEKQLAADFEQQWDSKLPDIVLYQAGADAWVNDPLGSGVFTAEQMRRRDELIFLLAKKYKVPLVFNLAGGYSRDDDGSIEPVLRLHRNTINTCIKIYDGA